MVITTAITANTITALAKSESASAYRFARAKDVAAIPAVIKLVNNFLSAKEAKT